MIGARHLYVHVPFCARRCSYCDFSIAVRQAVPSREFAAAAAAESAMVVSVPVALDTIYLGGGTPSKLGQAGIPELLARLADRGVAPAPGAEITVEANPEDISPEAIESWRRAGVNRLSLGVQSFDPGVLEWMHRTHTADQAVLAVHVARAGGIANISGDLIYAIPARLGRDWAADVETMIGLGVSHVSAYGLTVEPKTPLGRWTARGTEHPASDDQAADEFLEAHRRLTAAGFEHYEVSNYGLPGLRSRHNSAYWRRMPYLGIGPSAHAFDGMSRRWNEPAFAAWQALVMDGRDPVVGSETLGPEAVRAEELYLGLRSDAGAQLRPDEAARAEAWVAEGWAVVDGATTRLTPDGWLRLDALVSSLG